MLTRAAPHKYVVSLASWAALDGDAFGLSLKFS
jgi:hypothetical protein